MRNTGDTYTLIVVDDDAAIGLNIVLGAHVVAVVAEGLTGQGITLDGHTARCKMRKDEG